ncbi:MAG: hypothetical protein ACYTGB_14885, partial [Planctomycetota bacterium]
MKTIVVPAVAALALCAGCVPSSPAGNRPAATAAPRIEMPPIRPAPERAPAPVKLSAGEMRELVDAARRGAGSDPGDHADPPGNLVIVSVYARDTRGRPLFPFPALGQ